MARVWRTNYFYYFDLSVTETCRRQYNQTITARGEKKAFVRILVNGEKQKRSQFTALISD